MKCFDFLKSFIYLTWISNSLLFLQWNEAGQCRHLFFRGQGEEEDLLNPEDAGVSGQLHEEMKTHHLRGLNRRTWLRESVAVFVTRLIYLVEVESTNLDWTVWLWTSYMYFMITMLQFMFTLADYVSFYLSFVRCWWCSQYKTAFLGFTHFTCIFLTVGLKNRFLRILSCASLLKHVDPVQRKYCNAKGYLDFDLVIFKKTHLLLFK